MHVKNPMSTDMPRMSVLRSISENTRIVSSNFTVTSSSISPSVILVPTVNTDGTVAYSIHPQTALKIKSPIKSCPIIPLSSHPQEPKPGSSKGGAKLRQPPAILPKFSPPVVAPEMSRLNKVLPSQKFELEPKGCLAESKPNGLHGITSGAVMSKGKHFKTS